MEPAAADQSPGKRQRIASPPPAVKQEPVPHAPARDGLPLDGPQHLVWVRVTAANYPSLEDDAELYFVYPRNRVLPTELALAHMVELARDDPQLAAFPVVEFAAMKRRKRRRPKKLMVTTEEELAVSSTDAGVFTHASGGAASPPPPVANMYCDGACASNGMEDASAAAAAVYEGNVYPPLVRKLAPGEKHTNVTAEWQAVELALEEVLAHPERFGPELCIHTDHRAIVGTLQGGEAGERSWLAGWADNAQRLGMQEGSYVKGDGTPPKNIELIQRVAALHRRVCEQRTLRLAWIKGHAGHPFQEQADKLAAGAARNKLDTRYVDVRLAGAGIKTEASAKAAAPAGSTEGDAPPGERET